MFAATLRKPGNSKSLDSQNHLNWLTENCTGIKTADGLKSCVPAEASTGLVPRPYTQVESGDTSPNPWAHFRI